MADRARIIASFEDILHRLRDRTGCCRTTVRLDLPALDLHSNAVAAESIGEGIKSLENETSLDQRKAVAVRWMEKHRRILVENDCLNTDPEVAPEREVTEVYGIRAEMVAPLVRHASLIGWVSVHHTKGRREWTEEEVAAVERSCEEFQRVLEDLEAGGALGVTRPQR